MSRARYRQIAVHSAALSADGSASGVNGHGSNGTPHALSTPPSADLQFPATPLPISDPRAARAVLAAIRTLDSSDSALLERMGFGERFGNQADANLTTTYGGRRDLYRSFGYPQTISLPRYRHRYERGDLASRLIDVYPDAVWGNGFDITEQRAKVDDVKGDTAKGKKKTGIAGGGKGPDDATPLELASAALAKRLLLSTVFNRADKLARLGHYSVVLIGVRDPNAKLELDKNGAPIPQLIDWSTEMPRLSSPDDIIYLRPVSEQNAFITKFDLSPWSERFGLPLEYRISSTIGGGAAGSNEAQRAISIPNLNVHWSRVIHVAHDLLEDNVFGRPYLKNIWNRLDDLDKIIGGGAEATLQRVTTGLHANTTGDVDITPEQIQEMHDMFERYRLGLETDIYTHGVDVKQLAVAVANFDVNAQTIISIICGTKSIPQRILLGSERGSLASTQDAKNWESSYGKDREKSAVPVVRAFHDRLITYGALPKPQDAVAGYDVSWSTKVKLGDDEKATLVAGFALANSNQVHAGDTVIMTSNEMRNQWLELDPIEVDEAENEAEADPNADGTKPEQVPADTSTVDDGKSVSAKVPAVKPKSATTTGDSSK